MSARTRSARLAVLALVAATVGVAACSDSTPTAPSRPVGRSISTRGPQAVLVPEDTLACRSGWIIAEGRYQCL